MSEEKSEVKYYELNFKGKLIIEMYVVALGFQHAIYRDEMIVSPSENSDENNETILKYGSTKITMHRDKSIFEKSPYLASFLFACDMYLRTILVADDFDFKSLKTLNLLTLYKSTNESFKKAFYECFEPRYGKHQDEAFWEGEIAMLSDTFHKLRYSDEKIDLTNLNEHISFYEFCIFLEKYTRQMIFECYGFNIPEQWRDWRVHRKESLYFINRNKKNRTTQREEEIL